MSSKVEASPDHSYAKLELGVQISARMVFSTITQTCCTHTEKWKRLVRYVLAELHMKNKSINPLVHQARAMLGHVESSENMIYNARRIGRRWHAIVSWISQKSDEPLTGILLVLEKGYIWERYAESQWRTALDKLLKKSNILRKAKELSKLADNFIKEVKLHLSFVNPPKHTVLGFSRCEGRNEAVLSDDTRSIAMVLEVIPHLKATGSADSARLMILLSYLANYELPVDLLYRGASPRKRWTKDGDIVEEDPGELGLSDDLIRICSPDTLTKVLSKLQSSSAIDWVSNSRFKLSERARDRMLNMLPGSTHSFWCLQALILASRSIPWKYLEQTELDANLLLSHVRYTLERAQRYCKVEDITPMARIDIALNVIESARFSHMEWKQSAIKHAEDLTVGLDDGYMRLCLAQRQCLLHRLSGEIDLASIALADGASYKGNRKLHAAYGHTVVQHALNHIQLDQLTEAMEVLRAWEPTSWANSAMEQTVLFRQQLIIGKILRYRGYFVGSLSYLERSQNIMNTPKGLNYIEDTSELACSLADTYLELDDPAKAESCLRAAIDRQASKQGILIIALAECLFAQEKLGEAERTLCRVSQCRLKLMKMDKLRLAILQAKLSHVQSQFGEAFRYWTEAMSNLRQFNLASGRTTRTILLSQCDVLKHQGLFDLERRTRNQLDALEECADAVGALYWIPGLRHWLNYLEQCN
ncbi:hypothetical protein PENCOP_c001G09023 [Penicillium coprophilum]|uniref:Uncharacterized protein n=1 Tax=Penicillium coprophilum TaxID=36646 RepID=A0A1V6VAP9_9EURO|nr:hypothetical protein PENCOP_c001G09023 [Penicillium coprophilum]